MEFGVVPIYDEKCNLQGAVGAAVNAPNDIEVPRQTVASVVDNG